MWPLRSVVETVNDRSLQLRDCLRASECTPLPVKERPSSVLALDLATLLYHAEWIYDVSYARDTPTVLAQRELAAETVQGPRYTQAHQQRDAADMDRNVRFKRRKRSRRETSYVDNKDIEEDANLDQDELNPYKQNFGRSSNNRQGLTSDKKRWDYQRTSLERQAETKEDELDSVEDPDLLLQEHEADLDPLAAPQQQYGDQLRIIYYNDATALELNRILEDSDLVIPPASKNDWKDGFEQVLLNAKEDGLLLEHAVLWSTDRTRPRKIKILY